MLIPLWSCRHRWPRWHLGRRHRWLGTPTHLRVVLQSLYWWWPCCHRWSVSSSRAIGHLRRVCRHKLNWPCWWLRWPLYRCVFDKILMCWCCLLGGVCRLPGCPYKPPEWHQLCVPRPIWMPPRWCVRRERWIHLRARPSYYQCYCGVYILSTSPSARKVVSDLRGL